MGTITVVGSSGAIGRRLLPYLKQCLPETDRVVGTYFSHRVEDGSRLDVTDADAITRYLGETQPATMIWLSGTKDVRRCEEDRDFAERLNARPVEALIRSIVTASPATRVVYISTDYVFDGARGSYRDDDECAPDTNYGRSKLMAELALRASTVDYLILRTAAVMIRGDGFLGWLLGQFKSGKPIDLFSNTYFSPTPVDLLSQAVAFLLRRPSWDKRVLHMAGSRLSRAEFGSALARSLGIDPSQVRGVLADVRSSTFRADLSLVTSDEMTAFTVNTWNEIVREASRAW